MPLSAEQFVIYFNVKICNSASLLFHLQNITDIYIQKTKHIVTDMKELKVFIAGSKELKQERNGIKIVSNDLSSIYSSRGIHITAHSYEHFDEDQDSYNDFIVNKADIVIFILDGFIGQKTEEEFMKAAAALNATGRPEMMIFMREYDNASITPGIARVQGLIMGCLGNGKYHVDYSSLDDLKAKAKERIMRYIDKLGTGEKTEKAHGGTQQCIPEYKEKRKNSRLLSGLVAALTAIVVFFGWQKLNEQPLLIFTGGGSVVDYIKDISGGEVNIKDYGEALYINLPSGNAWTMLVEEAVRKNEDNERPFVSVVLSADKIDSVHIDYKVQNIKQDACIVGYFMGHDSLAVYIENSLAKAHGIDESDTELDAGKLAYIISHTAKNRETARLFTTNISSGTLRMYQRVIKDVDSTINLEKMLDKEISHPYYQDSSSDYIYALETGTRMPYMILGSEHYYPRLAENYRKLHISADGKIQMKEMYIYFVAYKNGEKNHCHIAPEITELLEKIGAERNMKPEVWKEVSEGRLRKPGGHTIFYLNK